MTPPQRSATAARPDFQAWPLARALRHRALVLRDAEGATLLSATPPEPLLVQAIQVRLHEPLALRIDADEVAERLQAAERDFRALDGSGVESGTGTERQDSSVHELSSASIAAQASAAVRLLDALLHDTLRDGASDLHVECDSRGAQVRVRIDGLMQPRRRIDSSGLAEQLVSRLKVLAELDIGERRLPQDGRFRLRLAGSDGAREVDFRLSVMPTLHGEDAVLRVLDRATLDRGDGLTLATLGFAPALAARLRQLASLPHGLVLATGPTGSGKTTTLYALLAETLRPDEKLVTLEDPVEYRLGGVVQIPVNDKKGLTFARGLRSVLRHDPDRVMVGEIRDGETAQIAVQAALTGHLVLSSVHANTALDVIGRLMHMGLDAWQTVAALEAVLAQRLVRVRCTACGGRGCAVCGGSGFKGRRAIAELLRLDDELRDLLVARAPLVKLKAALAERGHHTLLDAAADALAEGWTTPQELARVTSDA